jgi:hypothetical protein
VSRLASHARMSVTNRGVRSAIFGPVMSRNSRDGVSGGRWRYGLVRRDRVPPRWRGIK